MPHKTDINKLASQKWTSSGLSNEQARRLKLRGLAGDETKKLSVSFMPAGSLLIPYFDADGEPTKFFRIRYLEDLPGFKGQAKKPQRYAQPPGSLNEVYLPPLLKGRTWKQVLSDIETTLYITEGELKAACATARGLPTIGLGGVDVWRSQRRKMPLLPQLEDVVWKGRKVVIVFDSDAATNTDVVRAQRQLSKTLTERGAAPTVAALPPTPDGKKQGLDDFLVANGVDALKDIVDGAASTEEAQALWAMNEEVVFIRDPGLVVERKTGARMATQVFTGSVYANRTHVDYSGEKPKRVKTAQRWIEWPERFEASRLTYSPGKEQLVDGMWNLWQGWGVEPKKGDVSPWLRLLDFIFKDEVAARQWFER